MGNVFNDVYLFLRLKTTMLMCAWVLKWYRSQILEWNYSKTTNGIAVKMFPIRESSSNFTCAELR